MRSFQELHQKYSIGKLIKKLDDRYGFQALIRNLTGHWFNPFATLYINFFSFPFQQAIKFPMFVCSWTLPCSRRYANYRKC